MDGYAYAERYETENRKCQINEFNLIDLSAIMCALDEISFVIDKEREKGKGGKACCSTFARVCCCSLLCLKNN